MTRKHTLSTMEKKPSVSYDQTTGKIVIDPPLPEFLKNKNASSNPP